MDLLLLGKGLRFLIVAGLLAGPAGVCAAADLLSQADRQLLREGHAENLAGGSGSSGKFRSAFDRARKLGLEGNTDAALFLLDLNDRTILYAFAEAYSVPAIPELEIQAMKHLRNPAYGPCFSAVLVRSYQLRALYDALLAEAMRGEDGSAICARAIVRTNLPGIEPDLAKLLPRLDDYYAQTAVAEALVSRKHVAAEPALIGWLQRSTERTAGSASWIVVKLDSPEILNAIARRLADFRGYPPGAELESTLTSMSAAILYATPQVALDRRLFSPQVIGEFPAAYRPKLLAMLKDRDEVEARAGDMTPDNLAHWIRQNKNERVRAFIKAGVDLNSLGKSSGDRPLHAAAKAGNVEALELLLAAGANPNGKDWQGATPLKEIAGRKSHDDSLDGNNLTAAKALLAAGADPSMPASDTWTPLHTATALKFASMARLLVEGGANVNAEASEQGIQGLTPTQIADDHAAVDRGYGGLAAYLRANGGKISHAFLAKRAAQRAYINAIAPFLHQH